MTEQTLSIEALERQHRLWLQLASALERAQNALLRGDIAVFDECTKEQGECCCQLIPRRELELSSLRRFWRKLSAHSNEFAILAGSMPPCCAGPAARSQFSET
jgi:hypothetical protein